MSQLWLEGGPTVALRGRQMGTRKRNSCCLDEPDLWVNHAKGKWVTSLDWSVVPSSVEAFPLQLGAVYSPHVQLNTLYGARQTRLLTHSQTQIPYTKHRRPEWIQWQPYFLWLLQSTLLLVSLFDPEDSYCKAPSMFLFFLVFFLCVCVFSWPHIFF